MLAFGLRLSWAVPLAIYGPNRTEGTASWRSARPNVQRDNDTLHVSSLGDEHTCEHRLLRRRRQSALLLQRDRGRNCEIRAAPRDRMVQRDNDALLGSSLGEDHKCEHRLLKRRRQALLALIARSIRAGGHLPEETSEVQPQM